MIADHIDYVQDTCYAMWLVSIQVAIHQDEHLRFYILENPYSASSWALETSETLHQRPGCEFLRVDQCMFGLTVAPDGEMLSQKGSLFFPLLCLGSRQPYGDSTSAMVDTNIGC